MGKGEEEGVGDGVGQAEEVGVKGQGKEWEGEYRKGIHIKRCCHRESAQGNTILRGKQLKRQQKQIKQTNTTRHCNFQHDFKVQTIQLRRLVQYS